MVTCLIRHRIFDLRSENSAGGEQGTAKTPFREDSFDLLRQMDHAAEPSDEPVTGLPERAPPFSNNGQREID